MEELDNFLVDIVVDPASVVHIDFDWEHEMHLELDHLLLMKKKNVASMKCHIFLPVTKKQWNCMRLYLQRLVLTRNLMDIEVLLDNCPVEIVLDFHMVASLVEALYLVVA